MTQEILHSLRVARSIRVRNRISQPKKTTRYFHVPIIAILGFATGSPPLYPGDCIQAPVGPGRTIRVVQQIGYDPPQFEVEFETCKPTPWGATEGNAGTSRPAPTTADTSRP